MSVMVAMLRRHGATMVQRHGRWVPAHFGSVASEEAVCRSRVGLTERSDRATLEVRGPSGDVDRALAELATLGDRAWWARVAAGRAIVRCDGDDEGACASLLVRADDVSVLDVSAEHVAIGLVGPLAEEVLRAAEVADEDRVIVLRERSRGVELLVARTHGPWLWNRLLQAGEPLGITCVGLDAIEQLAVSEHLDWRRRPPAQAATGAGEP